MYRYVGQAAFNNDTKSNPGWYGDFLGDWREEFIVPDNTKLDHLNVFSTWYPSEYKLPYLMSDHTYYMQCLHENVGYNQPTNVGYYLGSDYANDAEIWAAAKVADKARESIFSGISTMNTSTPAMVRKGIYSLSGQKVEKPTHGLYIIDGKKVYVR
jgi:rhamnogalacturonan endolyase